MSTNYEVESWQGLIQMTVNLIGRGYHFYHITYLPVEKEHKWKAIDKKLIEKYKTDKSKYQRARQKNNGVANFFYLRWENIAVILHTKGKILDDIGKDDRFDDVRKKPCVFKINTEVAFRIGLKNVKGENKTKVDIRLDKDTYKRIKEVLLDVANSGKAYLIKREFNKINGFPAYAGIVEQKANLRTFVIERARQNHIYLKVSDLRFYTKRHTVKVWKNEESEE